MRKFDQVAIARHPTGRPAVTSRRVVAEGKVLNLESIDVAFTTQPPTLVSLDRISLKKPQSVMVIPQSSMSTVSLIVEYAAGPEARILKFPTGRVEEDEEPSEAALRELSEEIGYHADMLTKLGQLHDDPGHSNANTTLFLAEHLRPASASGDEPEQPLVVELSHTELVGAIRSGHLTDSRTAAAVVHLLIHRNAIGVVRLLQART